MVLWWGQLQGFLSSIDCQELDLGELTKAWESFSGSLFLPVTDETGSQPSVS